jgi:cation diffusion facilitator family transporter
MSEPPPPDPTADPAPEPAADPAPDPAHYPTLYPTRGATSPVAGGRAGRPVSRLAWLPIGAALATMALKLAAWWTTRSVGLLADALESVVNLAAAVVTLAMLRVAERPPDDRHLYGHDKAEYFASGAEGMLIVLAAASIAGSAAERLLNPQSLDRLGLGLVLAGAAAAINLAVGWVLVRAGRRHRSVALRGSGLHLLTDVWTTVGVFAALGLVAATGLRALDPLAALAVAAHVAWTGVRLVRSSVGGLMDLTLPAAQVAAVTEILDRYASRGARYHALRTRRAGARSFVSFHVQVPGSWTVQRGHDLLEAIEEEIRERLPEASVLTHLEPLEDPRSWSDVGLDRRPPPPG